MNFKRGDEWSNLRQNGPVFLDGFIERPLLIAVISLFLAYPVVAATVTLLGGSFEMNFMDFGAYYSAANRLLDSQSLYYTPRGSVAPSHPGGNFPYLYPPITILPFIPLAFLPFSIASLIWTLGSFFFVLIGAKKILQAYGVEFPRWKTIILGYAIFAYAPTIIWFKLGQITGIFVGSLLIAGAYLERKPDGWIVDISLLLPAIFKPPYAVALAPTLNNWRRVTRVSIIGLFMVVASVLLFGIEAHQTYLVVLSEGKGWHLDPLPISKFSFFVFRPFYIFGDFRVVLRLILLASLIGYVLFRRSQRPAMERAIFALGITAIPLLHPTTNSLALNALLPAYLVVIASETRSPGGNLTVPLLSLALVQIHPYGVSALSWVGEGFLALLQPLRLFVPILQPALWGILILAGFIIYKIEYSGGLELPDE